MDGDSIQRTGENDGRPRRPLVVASYNVHRCVGTDGHRDPARIARVIREIDPDIIALQELESRFGETADAYQLRYLVRATGLAGIGDPTIIRPDSHYGNALLTRHRIEEIDHVDLSVEAGQEPRAALDVILGVGVQRVRVIATHLGLRAGERDRQVERLLALIDTPRHPHDLLVVLGDINEWRPWGRPLRRLRARLGRPPAPCTFPSRLPLIALDRIWVHPAPAGTRTQAHRTPLSRVGSDHLPLRTQLRGDGG